MTDRVKVKRYHMVVHDLSPDGPYQRYHVNCVFYTNFKKAAKLLASVNPQWKVLTIHSQRRPKIGQIWRGTSDLLMVEREARD